MHKRWYDIDPTVSLAVSLMRNASIMVQYDCADLIISKSKENGVDLADNILTDAFTYVLRRWYDTDQKVAESFEYLKCLPTEVQKEVALELINLLQEAETK